VVTAIRSSVLRVEKGPDISSREPRWGRKLVEPCPTYLSNGCDNRSRARAKSSRMKSKLTHAHNIKHSSCAHHQGVNWDCKGGKHHDAPAEEKNEEMINGKRTQNGAEFLFKHEIAVEGPEFQKTSK